MTLQSPTSPLLTIVVTVLNEAENIFPVCQELTSVLKNLPPCEVIFVDDGSTDKTLERLLSVRDTILPQLRILSHSHPLGKSAGLRSAISASKAPWIATMDGDGQDDPSSIKTMLDAALLYNGSKQFPLIVGVRLKRQDHLSRRIATRIANGIRRRILHDGCPDTGAPLKLFPREIFLALPQFEGLHRFLPALMGCYNIELICTKTEHRYRLHGTSKYTNLNRAFVGIRDLLGVLWLKDRTRPLLKSKEL